MEKFPCEVIVVESGKDTYPLFGARFIHSKKGRAVQMNIGAEFSQGDHLFFLHADSILPETWYMDILASLEKKSWGVFRIKITGAGILLQIIAFFMNIRSCLSGITTGDMGQFVKKDVFYRVGEFPEIPLMEDITISSRLKKVEMPDCLKNHIETSSRKWKKEGIISTVLKMWMIRLLYLGGVSPERLYKIYYG